MNNCPKCHTEPAREYNGKIYMGKDCWLKYMREWRKKRTKRYKEMEKELRHEAKRLGEDVTDGIIRYRARRNV